MFIYADPEWLALKLEVALNGRENLRRNGVDDASIVEAAERRILDARAALASYEGPDGGVTDCMGDDEENEQDAWRRETRHLFTLDV